MDKTKAALKKQIEFYFSDSNYIRDNFLRETANKDPEGYVSIEILSTFARTRNLLKDVDEDKRGEVFQEALADSKTVKVKDDRTGVKRLISLPEEDTYNKRVVYVKNVSKEATIEDIMEYFAKNGDYKVLSVRIRRTRTKEPKGSAFVEFDTVEAAESAANKEDFPKFEGVEKSPTTERKNDYYKRKTIEKSVRNEERKRRREGDNDPEREDKKEQKIPDDFEYPKGSAFIVKNLGKDTTREDLKEVWSEGYVRFDKGDEEASVSFRADDKAIEAIADLEDGKKFGGHEKEAEVKLLEGEEEKEFWWDVQKRKDGYRESKKRSSYHRGGARHSKRSRRDRDDERDKDDKEEDRDD